VIRRSLKRGLGVARTAARIARGLVEGPGGPGYEVGEYEDFERIRQEAADQDRAEGVSAVQGEHDAIEGGTRELSAEELRILLEVELSEDHPQLLDVRSKPAWKAAHIPGALNIPLDALGSALTELTQKRAIILYGESDTQSIDASYLLKKAGFSDVASLAGGIDSWVGAGNEVAEGPSKT
tara:strand:+ start:1331 stop:1873 length:543 start_codon:yes stop_codon:yes gene_type:complete